MADGYVFTHEWRVNVTDLKKLLHSSSRSLNSPDFNSPSGAQPTTKWVLYVDIYDNKSTQNYAPPPGESSADEQSLSVKLKLYSCSSGVSSIWVEARLKSHPSNFEHVTEYEATSPSQGPLKMSIRGSNVISSVIFDQCLPLFIVQDSYGVTFECEIKVFSDEPAPLSTHNVKPNFSLSRFMEEARQSNLFTDVTLVADGKEYKAHKVVLATQSHFFKTRFSGRWTSPTVESDGDRVEMADVSAAIMEAMLAYMYTGEVADIGKTAYQLLHPAEEYGLVGLRKMCEGELIQSLTIKTVINTLIYAADHNATDLKKACMEFVLYNTSTVRQSEGWGKLKKDQTHRDLWIELLEKIAENHN